MQTTTKKKPIRGANLTVKTAVLGVLVLSVAGCVVEPEPVAPAYGGYPGYYGAPAYYGPAYGPAYYGPSVGVVIGGGGYGYGHPDRWQHWH